MLSIGRLSRRWLTSTRTLSTRNRPLTFALSDCNPKPNVSGRKPYMHLRMKFTSTQAAISEDLVEIAAIENVSEMRQKRLDLPPHLRPYQVEAIEACMAALDRGVRRIGVSSPTGSGKTVIFTQLIPLLIGKEAHVHGQVLILVGNIDLARQAIKTVRLSLPHLSVELEQGNHRASGRAAVTVATYQSLIRGERLAKFDPANFKGVIIDEAHHAAAPSYIKLLSYFNVDVGQWDEGNALLGSDSAEEPADPTESMVTRTGPRVPLIGFTATFSRHDQLALSQVFEEIVFHQDVVDMLGSGFLSPAKFTNVKADIKLDDVKLDAKTGDFSSTSLASVVNVAELHVSVVQAWLEKAANRKSTLLFAVDIPHTIALTNAFRQAGIDARYVTASTNDRERKTLLEGFKAGEFSVLANCQVFLEGTDLPNVDCIICARPTRSRNLYSQMIGRGLRKHPGKEDCLIIDLVDNLANVEGLVSAPTLWGLQNAEPADGESKDENEDTAGAWSHDLPEAPKSGAVEADYSLTFTDVEDPFKVISTEGSRAGRKPYLRDGYCWVACGPDKYVLDGFGHYFSILRESPSPSNGHKTIFLVRHAIVIPKEERTLYGAGRAAYGSISVHGRTGDLKHALEVGNKLVERYVSRGMWHQLKASAPWRREPATAAQVAVLLKSGYAEWASGIASPAAATSVGRGRGKGVLAAPIASSPDVSLEHAFNNAFAGMTKGKAVAIMTALRHGVKTRVRASMRKKAQVDKKADKEVKRKERDVVKVGKLR